MRRARGDAKGSCLPDLRPDAGARPQINAPRGLQRRRYGPSNRHRPQSPPYNRHNRHRPPALGTPGTPGSGRMGSRSGRRLRRMPRGCERTTQPSSEGPGRCDGGSTGSCAGCNAGESRSTRLTFPASARIASMRAAGSSELSWAAGSEQPAATAARRQAPRTVHRFASLRVQHKKVATSRSATDCLSIGGPGVPRTV